MMITSDRIKVATSPGMDGDSKPARAAGTLDPNCRRPPDARILRKTVNGDPDGLRRPVNRIVDDVYIDHVTCAHLNKRAARRLINKDRSNRKVRIQPFQSRDELADIHDVLVTFV
jgi:hypothetical protein